MEILREPSCQNWYARKATFARSRLCQRGRNYMLHAAWYLARLYEISYVKGVERNKKIAIFKTVKTSFNPIDIIFTYMHCFDPLY